MTDGHIKETPTACIIFNPHVCPVVFISCLNMKVVCVTDNRIISNLIIIQTTVFMQITVPSSPFLTSFMWLDHQFSLWLKLKELNSSPVL